MQVIFKYEITEMMEFSIVEAPILMPLKVDFQNGKPFLWAVVDLEHRPKKFKIFRVGTGHPMSPDIALDQYLNTTVMSSEPYVWHWFWKEVD